MRVNRTHEAASLEPLRGRYWVDLRQHNNNVRRTNWDLVSGRYVIAEGNIGLRQALSLEETTIRVTSDRIVKFSASSRLHDLNRSTTNIPSACRIANIALNDAMILPYDANPGRMEFSERTGA